MEHSNLFPLILSKKTNPLALGFAYLEDLRQVDYQL